MLPLSIVAILILSFSGCASLKEYDPLQSALTGDFLLNESGFAKLKNGMTVLQVHEAMGDELTVGYTLSKEEKNYKPHTIPNPYKAEIIKTANAQWTVEYYVARIAKPDGVITDKELIPLIYKNGVLIDQGWPALKQLKSLK